MIVKNATMAGKGLTDEEILEILDDSDASLSDLLGDSDSEDDDSPEENDRPPTDVIPLIRIPEILAGDANPAQGTAGDANPAQGTSTDNTGRKKKQKIKSNVKNIADTLNPQNYDIYEIPSEVKELSVTIKAVNPPRKIDWTNQPPSSSEGSKTKFVVKGPVGQPQGKAKDCDTELSGIVI